jgi:hypothetical protein
MTDPQLPSPPPLSAEPLTGLEPLRSGALPYLSRYLAGEREAVWAELVALGSRVREEPFLTDATAVARETMRRAAENLRTIRRRLAELGYAVTGPDGSDPARERAAERLEAFESAVGPLPLSIRAWHEAIGPVDFRVGRRPDGEICDETALWGMGGIKVHRLPAPGRLPAGTRRVVFANIAMTGLVARLSAETADSTEAEVERKALFVKDPVTRGMGLVNCVVRETHRLGFVEAIREAFRFGGFPPLRYPSEDRTNGRRARQQLRHPVVSRLASGLIGL